MEKVSCGLPATMTLLASLTAHRANNENNELLVNTILVDLSDLLSIFGEMEKFRSYLYYDERVETLSVSSLLALYLLGINNGSMRESEVMQLLEEYEFEGGNISLELEDLILSSWKKESTYWNINELSYGTFAFLRLFLLSNSARSDAQKIAKVLKMINEAESPPPGKEERIEDFDLPEESKEIDIGSIYQTMLKNELSELFSLDELKILAFELKIDPDSVSSAQQKDSYAMDLVLYLRRRGRINELLEPLKKLRPKHRWSWEKGSAR